MRRKSFYLAMFFAICIGMAVSASASTNFDKIQESETEKAEISAALKQVEQEEAEVERLVMETKEKQAEQERLLTETKQMEQALLLEETEKVAALAEQEANSLNGAE